MVDDCGTYKKQTLTLRAQWEWYRRNKVFTARRSVVSGEGNAVETVPHPYLKRIIREIHEKEAGACICPAPDERGSEHERYCPMWIRPFGAAPKSLVAWGDALVDAHGHEPDDTKVFCTANGPKPTFVTLGELRAWLRPRMRAQ